MHASACRAVDQAELAILRRRERSVGLGQPAPAAGAFGSQAMLALRSAGRSGVARTSLLARHRWDVALQKVLVMNRVARAFTQSTM